MKDFEGTPCAAIFEPSFGMVTANQYLEILARGLKYILPRGVWDYDGPIDWQALPDHLNCAQLERTFCQFNSDSMLDNDSDIDQCIRESVLFSRGLNKKHCKWRLRKKRITRYRKWVRGQIRKSHPGGTDPTKCIVLFANSIKRQFLSSRRVPALTA